MRIYFSEDMTTFMVSHPNDVTFTFIQKYAFLLKMTEFHDIETDWRHNSTDWRNLQVQSFTLYITY